MKTKILFLIAIALIMYLNISAQTVNTKSVYLHTDRSYYAPGESVYFKAYILNSPDQINDTLHVALIDYEGLEITNGAFPLENSLFSSSIDIPDFLTEGSYMLVASTNLTNNYSPENMFSKIVEIRNTKESDLNIDISFTDSYYKPGSILTAHVKMTGSAGPVNFSYQLTGTSGEILNGKEKTTGEGTSVLKIQLPEFDNKQILKLIIKPGFKGNKRVFGIIIPTNPAEIPARTPATSIDVSHLNIQVSTLKQVYVSGDKVQLAISVTDEKGQPTMANLSVSAYSLIPFQFPADYNNIVEYTRFNSTRNWPGSDWNKTERIITGSEITNTFFNADIRNYYALSLKSFTLTPGRSFIVQEKNIAKKIQKKQQTFVAKSGYSTDLSLMDIIMQIKPYHIENGKITFGMRSPNSINNQDGALIVVDGVKLGSDAGILSTIPVVDIGHINVLTNPMDVQRYSGMNSVGVIEITMKKSAEFAKKEQPVSNATLFWEPNLIIDNSGKKLIDFLSNDNAEEVIITINGINGKGIYGSASMQYSVTH